MGFSPCVKILPLFWPPSARHSPAWREIVTCHCLSKRSDRRIWLSLFFEQPAMRKSFNDLVNEHIPLIEEIFPWDLADEMALDPNLLLVDIRCPDEFRLLRIEHAIAVPRGILESACDYGYDETAPELVEARQQRVVLVCRSGNRSVLAAHTLQMMGYSHVASLKTGLKGWNDYDLPLINERGVQLDADEAERLLNPPIPKSKLGPTQPGPVCPNRGMS